jgi:LacI family transcriptional regulator
MAIVTIKDIAKKLGISTATVSLALNDRPGVNALTKKKVLELVKELNYTGNTTKKVPQNNGVISFLVYKRYGKIIADTQFFADLIEAVEKAARSLDYTVALTYCTGRENLDDIIKPVLAAQPEGIIILGTEMAEEDLEVFEAVGLPIVVLDNELFGCSVDTVTIHNGDGVWKAMKYLYDQGHQDIGYLKSSFSIKNFEQRMMGFEFCLKKLGLPYKAENIFMLEPTVEGAHDDICALIEHDAKFPKAIVADNDLIALGALKGFLQNGIKVPEDISLIGFDDIPMASIFEPALTSVFVSRKDLGYSAVEQLLWRIKHVDAPFRRISIGTNLTLRNSVKAFSDSL